MRAWEDAEGGFGRAHEETGGTIQGLENPGGAFPLTCAVPHDVFPPLRHHLRAATAPLSPRLTPARQRRPPETPSPAAIHPLRHHPPEPVTLLTGCIRGSLRDAAARADEGRERGRILHGSARPARRRRRAGAAAPQAGTAPPPPSRRCPHGAFPPLLPHLRAGPAPRAVSLPAAPARTAP